MSTSFLPHSTFTFTSPEGSPVYPDAPDTSFSFLLPISPPAPHRRAPRPPKASTKRRTGRHIQMREPSQCGLFTVSELPEGESTVYECMEEDFPQDVSGDEGMGDCTFLQTPSASPSPNPDNGSWGTELATPLGEGEDPFGAGWTTIPLGGCETGKDFEMAVADANRPPITPPQAQPLFAPLQVASKSTSRLRRPPPLTLTTRFSLPPPSAATSAATPALSGHPFSAISAADSELLTPRSGISPATSTLMPALPIVAQGEWSTKCGGSPTTPTRKSWKRHARSDSAEATRARKRHSPDDTVDLAMALEELLASCGESVDFSSSSSSSSSASASDSETASSSEDDFASKSLRFPVPPSRPVGLGISSPTSHPLFPASPSISSSTGTSPLSIPPRTPRTPEKSVKAYQGSPKTPAHFAPKKPARAHPHSQLPPSVSFSSLGHASGDSCDRAASPSSLRGDHSFLASMSRSESPASSTGSVGSRGSSSLGSASTGGSKRLPGRKALPMEWRFGQMI
ncbi:hypothetical protein IAT38_005299 [Cryptococcus sp. DSM 104549]